MLHHAFGEVNGKKGVWGHAIGGMGAITQAMAKAARGHGVEIETDAGVREVIVERDRAAGVILDNGATVRARYVVSGVNPKLLYTRLVPADALPPVSTASGNGAMAPARSGSTSRSAPCPRSPRCRAKATT